MKKPFEIFTFLEKLPSNPNKHFGRSDVERQGRSPLGLFFSLVFLFLLWNISFVEAKTDVGDMTAEGLRCESLVNPLGIDVPRPHLSWRLSSDAPDSLQSAWRVLVASSRDKLELHQGDLWDSGKVSGSESLDIEYKGETLNSGQRCFWKVQVWDKSGRVSPWSEIAFWETGLLHEEDWQGVWLNDGKKPPIHEADFYKDDPAPLFRYEFKWDKKIKDARLYIAGLGYYEARLNGELVGDHVLDPPWTKPTRRVYYSTFDVTDQLRSEGGTNCLGVTLGNGWYNPLPMKMWGKYNLRDALDVGRPRFIVQLNVVFDDGTKAAIYSRPEWKTAEGPIRWNNIYLGEIRDARLELDGWDRPGFDDSSWKHAAPATEPTGRLQSINFPPVRIRDSFHAVSVHEPKPGVFVYDMGENFGGWASLTLNVPSGTKIVLRYGELLYPDGMLNPMTSVCGQIKRNVKNAEGKEESIAGPGAPPIAWQTDTYIAKGAKNEFYRPRFTFHAFRYVEVVGLTEPLPLESVQGWRLCSDVAPCGEFSCSNEELNKIQSVCRRTFLSNLFSVQSDCPHRERFGYGGDIVATSDAFIMNFDMATFYAKTVNDWADAALADGMLTDTSPFVGIQYCGLVWALAHPELLGQLHRYYGNNHLITEQYETARRWLALVQDQYPQHIVDNGLADHEAIVAEKPNIMVTPLYYYSARLLEQLALQQGKSEDARSYGQLAKEIAAAYLKSSIDTKTGQVGQGSQAAQALVLYTDYRYPGFLSKELRENVLDSLLNTIGENDRDHLSTGILGTKFMLDQLSKERQIELAYRIVNQPDCPGWRWMLENGATTLWEHWKLDTATYSHNHPMFGSVSQWFFQQLGGIEPDQAANGFDRIRIAPQVVNDLDWVKTSYQSVRGEIVSNWNRDRKNHTVTFDVVIPANTAAQVILPMNEGDTVAVAILNRDGSRCDLSDEAAKKLFASREKTAEGAFLLGSGHYTFTVSNLK